MFKTLTHGAEDNIPAIPDGFIMIDVDTVLYFQVASG